MPLLLLGLLLLLAMAGPTSAATYCICKDGLSDSVLQKSIDYACGNGADCTQITQGGSCYNPNTVKDHCNYAVNSYFQKKGETTGSCDFTGTAITSPNPPNPSSGCVYPSSGSGGTPTTPGTPGTGTPGTGTPSTGTPSTGTPGTPSTGTPGTGTPSTPGTGTSTPSTPGTGTPGTGTGTGTGMGTPSTTVPGGSTTPFPGLGPTGGINSSLHQSTNLFYSLTLTLWFSGLMFLRA